MSTRYRKRPIVVDAFQLTDARRSMLEWPLWLIRAAEDGLILPQDPDASVPITNLEGTLLISWGDWIIRGVQGEISSCTPDIFDATYEAVSEDDPPG